MNQYSNNRIVCSVYDPNIPVEECESNKVEYYPNISKGSKKIFVPISTDGYFIYDGEKLETFEVYFSSYKKERHRELVVLTNKERSILLPWLIKFRVSVTSLEKSFPIFSGVRFNSNVKLSYRKLSSKINYLKKINLYPYNLASNFDAELKKL